LMKILSGYDSKNKTDYRAKVAEEIDQLRRKTELLSEMLMGVQENETIGQGDVFEVFPFLGNLLIVGSGNVDKGIKTKITENDRR